MKVKVKVKEAREIVYAIEMTESELLNLMYLIGGTTEGVRQSVCPYKLDDELTGRIFESSIDVVGRNKYYAYRIDK